MKLGAERETERGGGGRAGRRGGVGDTGARDSWSGLVELLGVFAVGDCSVNLEQGDEDGVSGFG